MNNIHPSIINHNSRLYSHIAKLECMFYDFSAKQVSLIPQSAPEQVIWVWEIASSGVRRAGRIVSDNSHAKAEALRGFGRIIQQLIKLCECGFKVSIKLRIRTKQRARRRRAAYSLTTDDDGVLDSAEYYWNTDTDGDGKINARDPDSDNDGLTDGTEMGVTKIGQIQM